VGGVTVFLWLLVLMVCWAWLFSELMEDDK
jgi:hypothetical protein